MYSYAGFQDFQDFQGVYLCLFSRRISIKACFQDFQGVSVFKGFQGVQCVSVGLFLKI